MSKNIVYDEYHVLVGTQHKKGRSTIVAVKETRGSGPNGMMKLQREIKLKNGKCLTEKEYVTRADLAQRDKERDDKLRVENPELLARLQASRKKSGVKIETVRRKSTAGWNVIMGEEHQPKTPPGYRKKAVSKPEGPASPSKEVIQPDNNNAPAPMPPPPPVTSLDEVSPPLTPPEKKKAVSPEPSPDEKEESVEEESVEEVEESLGEEEESIAAASSHSQQAEEEEESDNDEEFEEYEVSIGDRRRVPARSDEDAGEKAEVSDEEDLKEGADEENLNTVKSNHSKLSMSNSMNDSFNDSMDFWEKKEKGQNSKSSIGADSEDLNDQTGKNNAQLSRGGSNHSTNSMNDSFHESMEYWSEKEKESKSPKDQKPPSLRNATGKSPSKTGEDDSEHDDDGDEFGLPSPTKGAKDKFSSSFSGAMDVWKQKERSSFEMEAASPVMSKPKSMPRLGGNNKKSNLELSYSSEHNRPYDEKQNKKRPPKAPPLPKVPPSPGAAKPASFTARTSGAYYSPSQQPKKPASMMNNLTAPATPKTPTEANKSVKQLTGLAALQKKRQGKKVPGAPPESPPVSPQKEKTPETPPASPKKEKIPTPPASPPLSPKKEKATETITPPVSPKKHKTPKSPKKHKSPAGKPKSKVSGLAEVHKKDKDKKKKEKKDTDDEAEPAEKEKTKKKDKKKDKDKEKAEKKEKHKSEKKKDKKDKDKKDKDKKDKDKKDKGDRKSKKSKKDTNTEKDVKKAKVEDEEEETPPDSVHDLLNHLDQEDEDSSNENESIDIDDLGGHDDDQETKTKPSSKRKLDSKSSPAKSEELHESGSKSFEADMNKSKDIAPLVDFFRDMEKKGIERKGAYPAPLEKAPSKPREGQKHSKWKENLRKMEGQNEEIREKPKALPTRLQNVKGETLDSPPSMKKPYKPPKFKKSKKEENWIKQSIKITPAFTGIAPSAVAPLVDAFERVEYNKGSTVAKQGGREDKIFVVQDGEVSFHDRGQKIGSGKAGSTFGEMALRYPVPRAVEVKAESEHTVLFQLDQKNYRNIIRHEIVKEEDARTKLLRALPFFKDVDESDLRQLSSAMKSHHFSKGDNLTKEFAEVPFCLVQEGSLSIKDLDQGSGDRGLMDYLVGGGGGTEVGPGEVFGEQVLSKKDAKRLHINANSDGIANTIGRRGFEKVFGNMDRLLGKARDKKILAEIKSIKAANLPEPDLDAMVRQIANVKFEGGKDIFTNNQDMTPALYLVRMGKVEIATKDGTTEVKNTGDFFGQEYLLVPSKGGKDVVPSSVKAKYTATPVGDTVCGMLTLREIAAYTSGPAKKKADLDKSTFVPMENLVRHRILGEGQFGTVWLVTNKKAKKVEPYALKIQETDDPDRPDAIEAIKEEVDVMKVLQCPFVVQIICTYDEPRSISMLLSVAPGGELFDVIHQEDEDGDWHSGLEESVASFYATVVADALAFMHHQRYLFRDLKPENVLIDKHGYPVITDFGFAKYVGGKLRGRTYTFCGTPQYICPEIASNIGHSYAADNWTIGILIYELILGDNPFYEDGVDQSVLYDAICNKEPYYDPADVISPEAKSLINRLLEKDPSKRLGSFREKDILEDPWLSQYKISGLRSKKVKAPWIPDAVSLEED